jgi:hypothetical protein
MLESEWMRSQRFGPQNWPAARTQFLSRAAIERNHGSRVHFFRFAHPARIIE